MSVADELPDMEIVTLSRMSDEDWDIDVDAGDTTDPHLVLGILVMGVARQIEYLSEREEDDDDE